MQKIFVTVFALLGFILLSHAQSKHEIGENFGGGIVFIVSADGLHGVIAETKVQGKCKFNKALELIANPENHSESGKTFTDWRLPTSEELCKIYQHKNIVDPKKMYWSSTENDGCNSWCKCVNMKPWGGSNKYGSAIAHAVRDF